MQAGAYFVTICTKDRECFFGDMEDGEMRVNEYGRIADESWSWLSRQYDYVEMDEWVVMPNHLHGILVIHCRGGSRTAPTETTNRKSLGRLIGAFKTVSTKQINDIRNTPGHPIWQRNYYEHIIRGEEELHRIRRYITENPLKWADDEDHPGNIIRRGEVSSPSPVAIIP